MNVFSFVQWNKYFYLVKDEMFHSIRLRLVECMNTKSLHLLPHENISSIALININYCTLFWTGYANIFWYL